MKKPVVDYSKFRLKKIGEPEYKHLLWLLGWVIYFTLYFLTENLIPESACHEVHCALDDIIPFNEYFLIFYCSWYVLIVASLLYYMLYDPKYFVKLQQFLIVTQILAMVVYIVYPTVQYLRPEEFVRDNFGTRLMSFIYAFDTPTGVCPSLHVAYSLGIASTWLKRKETSKAFKVFMIILVCLISISVCFVKQHSAVDIVWAIPLSILAEAIVFGKSYWLEKFKKK